MTGPLAAIDDHHGLLRGCARGISLDRFGEVEQARLVSLAGNHVGLRLCGLLLQPLPGRTFCPQLHLCPRRHFFVWLALLVQSFLR